VSEIAGVAWGFWLLVLVDAGHAASFFALLSTLGAVSAALMRGLQTVAVFVSSALLFCAVEETQCITPVKMTSIIFVLAGTLGYAAAPDTSSRAAGCDGAGGERGAGCDSDECLPLEPGKRDAPWPWSIGRDA
jgi:hypothetical protein